MRLPDLRRIKYKPGWFFRWAEDVHMAGGVGLVVGIETTDSYTGQRLFVEFSHYIPYPSPVLTLDEAFRDYIWQAILAAERHEAGEFFQWDGVRTHDPHNVRRIADVFRVE